MKEEYNYTLTVPKADLDKVQDLLDRVKSKYPRVRISRKPDRKESARFYLSFPYHNSRSDHGFVEWYGENGEESWDLFGPNYGVWGFN